MSTELEDQISRWIDDQVDGVAPVTVDEVLDRRSLPSVRATRSGPPRRWLLPAAAAVIAVVAGAIGVVVSDDGDASQEVVTSSLAGEAGADATPATRPELGGSAGNGEPVEPTTDPPGPDGPVEQGQPEDGVPVLEARRAPGLTLEPSGEGPMNLFAPSDSAEMAVRTFLRRTVGSRAADSADIELQISNTYGSGASGEQFQITLPGQDHFTMTVLSDGRAWSVIHSGLRGPASSPGVVPGPSSTSHEVLYAYPSAAVRATIWFLGADGISREATIEQDMFRAGTRDGHSEVRALYQARGFANLNLEFLDLTGIERARAVLPRDVVPGEPVVLAYFDDDHRPMAVWMDRGDW